MNKVIKTTIIAFAALFIALNATAADETYSLYVSKSSESKKIVLRLDNMFADKVACTIYSDLGATIFKDEIYTAEKTAKQYDLNQLPEGNYIIEIIDLMKVEKLKLTITKESVEFENTEAEITYKPTVWMNEDKTVDFNLLSLGNNVKVSILNETRDEVFKKSYKKETTVSNRFDFSQLPKGTYTMVVMNGDETFYNYLSI